MLFQPYKKKSSPGPPAKEYVLSKETVVQAVHSLMGEYLSTDKKEKSQQEDLPLKFAQEREKVDLGEERTTYVLHLKCLLPRFPFGTMCSTVLFFVELRKMNTRIS